MEIKATPWMAVVLATRPGLQCLLPLYHMVQKTRLGRRRSKPDYLPYTPFHTKPYRNETPSRRPPKGLYGCALHWLISLQAVRFGSRPSCYVGPRRSPPDAAAPVAQESATRGHCKPRLTRETV